MAQWPDNTPPGHPRPEFDRTVIRPSAKPAQARPAAPADTSGPGKGPHRSSPHPGDGDGSKTRGGRIRYAALALGFLVFGGVAGGLAHLVTSGKISFSAPDPVAPDRIAGAPPHGEGPSSAQGLEATEDAPLDRQTDTGADAPSDVSLAEELDVPADPFFDMALSAVIPLAGDPVLLKDGSASRRIDLSERSVPTSAIGEGRASVPTPSAFVLDSQMLDDDGNLVIRAPGSEADFQFGNFGGGEDSDGLTIDEADADNASSAPDLPVFLKPNTDTLNLFLSERPIGQGPSRVEIREGFDKTTALKAFLLEKGFDADAIKPLLEFARTEFRKSDLIAGDKIALRGVRMPNRVGRVGDYYRPVQVSFHSSDGYLGTAALTSGPDGPAYVHGADPWFGKTIVQEDGGRDKAPAGGKKHRLIDGLYATAVRNAVPASIVGEAIAYLAPMTDLQRTIRDDERFTLVFTDAPRDDKRGGGRVLFAGIRRGNDWSVRCYVMKAPGNRGFACVNEGGQVSLSGAMLVPVKGVLTSKFGMRFHPIKKTERLHAGVDWAAPTGTPIRAAFSGKVTYRAVRGGYGNFIELSHKGGITSRYAHMHEYADGIELGSVVQAGDLIGYVGTTGLSTGPHLHFEIRMRGEPTDPLSFEMETGTDEPQSVASNDIKDYRQSITEILTVQ